jgi:hypothetical protein
VTEHLASLVARGYHDRQRDIGRERAVEVEPLAVDARGERGLGEALADRGSDLRRRRPAGDPTTRSIGQRDGDLVAHHVSVCAEGIRARLATTAKGTPRFQAV